eukprot:TRINITY_DN24064_c0_g1_i1.p1 TRINITY_DN24064_c0_g1~~TRINITY_DN24064_c0_g1_i1.p1  ORF type:complete len:974 (-),score=36.68 TRINITY_DN24064_c0_g1_i1:397-3318(-)
MLVDDAQPSQEPLFYNESRKVSFVRRLTISACCCGTLAAWIGVTQWAWSSGHAAHFATKAAGQVFSEDESQRLSLARFAHALPLSAMTYEVPIIVVVVDSAKGVSAESLNDEDGSFAKFSQRLDVSLSPRRSCFGAAKDSRMLVVQRLEGFHLESLPIEERRQMVSSDGTVSVIRVVMCGGPSVMNRALALTAHVRNVAIPQVLESLGPNFSSRFEVGVLEVSDVLNQAKTRGTYEFSHSDVITFPVAVCILVWAAGPLAIPLLLALPIALVSSFALLDYLSVLARVSCIGPPLFITLGVTLSLDYVLLLLARFNEEFNSLCQESSPEQCPDTAVAIREAVYTMMRQAGFSVLTSGLLLASAFAMLFFFASVIDVKGLGLGGTCVVLLCLLVSLTISPALILLLAECCPSLVLKLQSGRSRCDGSFCSRAVFQFNSNRCICSGNLSEIAVRWPRSLLLGVLLLTAPLIWRACALRVTIDQELLTPSSSEFSRFELALRDSGLPGSLVLPPLLILEGSDTVNTSRQEPPSSVDSMSPSSRCVDREALLSAFVPLIVPHDVLPPYLTLTCEALGKMSCKPDLLRDVLPIDFKQPVVREQWTLIREKICPRTCGACRKSDFLVLNEKLFDALRSIDLAFSESIRIAVGDGRNRTSGHLVHIGKLGSETVDLKDARRYLSGGPFSDATDAARAQRYIEHFVTLTNLAGNATIIKVMHPFACMSGDQADWGRNFLESLRHHGVLGKRFELGEEFETIVTPLWHEMPYWKQADETRKALLTASTLAIIILLVLTASIFRSVLLPPRLLLTVLLTLGIAYGVCGFVLDALQLPGLFWIIPPMTVPVVTGLTLDYDLFILTRVLEYREAGFCTVDSFVRGLESTRNVISVAGVIMAVAFFALCISEMAALREMGIILVTATLCDTFLVRPLVVPACALALGNPESIWWPRKMHGVSRDARISVAESSVFLELREAAHNGTH